MKAFHKTVALKFSHNDVQFYCFTADKEAKTFRENQTPVFYAAKTDAVQSLKTLIKRECLFKEERDYKGRTPIHVAAELGTMDFLVSLNIYFLSEVLDI